MHLFKTALFCSLLSISFHASTLSAASGPTEPPKKALMRIMDTLAKHGKESYPKDVMKMITTTIDLNKDHLNTPLLIEIGKLYRAHRTCLTLAIENQQSGIVESLLRHGASVKPIPVTSSPVAYIAHAIEYCQPEDIDIFATLLATDEDVTGTINSQKKPGDRSTILHDVLFAADDVANKDIIKIKACLLMYYGANPEIEDEDQHTAFDIAEDESFFPNKNDREDLMDILQKNTYRGPYYTRFLQKMLSIQGNMATYVHNREIYGLCATKKTTSRNYVYKPYELESAAPNESDEE